MNFLNILNLYGIEKVFKDIVIPSGVDKEILVNTIIDKCGLNEPMFYDMPLLNMKIQNFFLKNKEVFNRLYEACTLEYEMIENYDRKEFINRDSTKTNNYEYNSNTNTKEEITGNDVNIEQVSPYDGEGFKNSNKYSNDKTQENVSDLTDSGNNKNDETGKETEMKKWYSENCNVEVNVYPNTNSYCVVNNTYEVQDTRIYTDHDVFDIRLQANEIRWFSISGEE